MFLQTLEGPVEYGGWEGPMWRGGVGPATGYSIHACTSMCVSALCEFNQCQVGYSDVLVWAQDHNVRMSDCVCV